MVCVSHTYLSTVCGQMYGTTYQPSGAFLDVQVSKIASRMHTHPNNKNTEAEANY